MIADDGSRLGRGSLGNGKNASSQLKAIITAKKTFDLRRQATAVAKASTGSGILVCNAKDFRIVLVCGKTVTGEQLPLARCNR